MNELWKEVSRYDGLYEVSDQGRVRSYRTQRKGIRAESPRIIKGGIYLRVRLQTFKDRKSQNMDLPGLNL